MGTCERHWEVDALRDGVLIGHAAEEARSHIQGCASCKHHSANLDSLRASLSDPEPSLNPFARRRMRGEMIGRFVEEHRNQAKPARRTPRLALASLGMASLAAAALVGMNWADADGDSLTLAKAPSLLHVPTVRAKIVGNEAARWVRSRVGITDRVELHAGTVDIHVHEGLHGRFVVAVPEGEIEDIGTEFSVTVENGKTTSVRVTSGRVVFRRYEEKEIRLGAGEIWSATLASAPTPRAEPPLEAPSAASASAAVPSSAAPPQIASHTRSVIATNPPRGADGSAGEGLAAPNTSPVETSSKRSAEVGERETTGPSKPAHASALSEEDAAYMRVIVLLRVGSGGAAKLAAEDYLRRFPNGLRRVEVARLIE